VQRQPGNSRCQVHGGSIEQGSLARQLRPQFSQDTISTALDSNMEMRETVPREK